MAVEALPILIPLTPFPITLLSHLRTPARALLAIRFPLLDLRLSQLIKYTNILLFGRAFADAEPHINAEPSHPPHELKDVANLLAPDFAAVSVDQKAKRLDYTSCLGGLTPWSVVSLWK